MQEGHTEYISFDTMLEEIGVPDDVRRQLTQPEEKPARKPGQGIFEQRVRVSFEFDVRCDSGPVANESYDEGGPMDMALLKSFLVADKAKLMDMMVDAIGQKLGMHSCETFMHEFLPQVNTEPHELFNAAIEKLEGDGKRYWKDIRGEIGVSDILNLCTESIFECFTAEFVKSSYEVVEDKPKFTRGVAEEIIKDLSQQLREK